MTEAAPADPRRLPWRVAEVIDVVRETPRVASLVLRVPGWPGHLPGQHVELRLTGEDGSQAQRLYSMASAPEAASVSLTVERIEDGEVSPYLVGELRAGDRFELRGPIGGHFVWTAALGGPLFLIAGGSGVVPLVVIHSLTDHRRRLIIEKKGQEIEAHEDFMLVISYNPGYQTVLKDLKPSTKQRFIAINFDFPAEDVERTILVNEVSGLDAETAAKLVAAGRKARLLKDHGLEESTSTRALVYART